MRRARGFGIAAAGLLIGAACGESSRIALEDGSTTAGLVFTVSDGDDPTRIAAFRIDRCNARGSPAPESHWLTLAPDTAEAIARITYADPPVGWRSVQGPQPLVPGCYRAAVANAPPLEFDIMADGQAKARRER